MPAVALPRAPRRLFACRSLNPPSPTIHGGALMNTRAWIGIVVVVLIAAGCAGGVGPATVAPTVDITGKWVGTWTATRAALGSGSVTMTLKQTGSQYSGD